MSRKFARKKKKSKQSLELVDCTEKLAFTRGKKATKSKMSPFSYNGIQKYTRIDNVDYSHYISVAILLLLERKLRFLSE